MCVYISNHLVPSIPIPMGHIMTFLSSEYTLNQTQGSLAFTDQDEKDNSKSTRCTNINFFPMIC